MICHALGACHVREFGFLCDSDQSDAIVMVVTKYMCAVYSDLKLLFLYSPTVYFLVNRRHERIIYPHYISITVLF